MKKLIAAFVCVSVCVFGQNYAFKWHPQTTDGPPTNCIAQWQDIRGGTAVPPGFSFVTNISGARFYWAFSETNFNIWNSNNIVAATSNRTFWINTRDRALSNVFWFSTNATPANAILGASNAFVLRAAEERLK